MRKETDRPTPPTNDERLVLARYLYEAMERHDPSDAPPWDESSDWEKHYFEILVYDVVLKFIAMRFDRIVADEE
jgi:hypothetical protein